MNSDEFNIFDENYMNEQLNAHLSPEEILSAALYCNVLEINGKKTGLYGADAYAGVTQHGVFFVKAFKQNQFYLSFPFLDIQRCTKKKGLLGEITCFLSLKNGTTIKVLTAKRAGIGSKMCGHTKNRDEFLQCLEKYCVHSCGKIV